MSVAAVFERGADVARRRDSCAASTTSATSRASRARPAPSWKRHGRHHRHREGHRSGRRLTDADADSGFYVTAVGVERPQMR